MTLSSLIPPCAIWQFTALALYYIKYTTFKKKNIYQGFHGFLQRTDAKRPKMARAANLSLIFIHFSPYRYNYHTPERPLLEIRQAEWACREKFLH
jgi:hypothetical protein